MNKLLSIILFILLNNFLLAQVNWNDYNLLAEYTLTENTNDSSGSIDSLITKNITFDKNAAYSNGVTFGSFTNGCLIETPPINQINLNDFGFSLEIQFDTIYNTEMPVIIAGKFNRYLGIYLDMWQGKTKLSLVKNYGQYRIIAEDTLLVNKWYKIDLLHRLDTSYLYLDGKLIIKQISPLDFYDQENDPNSKVFTNTNSGESRTFRGLWRNLNFYSKSSTQTILISAKKPILYPNPSSDLITLSFDYDSFINSYKIVDINGKIIISEPINMSTEILNIDITQLKNGQYFILLNKENSKDQQFIFFKH